MFRVFPLARSTWPATKTARWLVDWPGHEQICCATSCEFDEKRATKPKFVAQSRPALYFSQQLSSFRNNCFCCATSWSHRVKNGKHRLKLATKQCCATSWGFLYLVFRRLKRLLACFCCCPWEEGGTPHMKRSGCYAWWPIVMDVNREFWSHPEWGVSAWGKT